MLILLSVIKYVFKRKDNIFPPPCFQKKEGDKPSIDDSAFESLEKDFQEVSFTLCMSVHCSYI